MPTNLSPAAKRAKPSHFPADVLAMVFSWLPAPSVVRCRQVCGQWLQLLRSQEAVLWRRLCRNDFNLRDADRMGRSWVRAYRLHDSFYREDYSFLRTETGAQILRGGFVVFDPEEEEEDRELKSILSTQQSLNSSHDKAATNLFVWPCENNRAYHIAFQDNLIFWIDVASSENLIHVGSCPPDPDEGRRILSRQTLDGGPSMVSLLLANGTGQLCTFDEGSSCTIWDVASLTRQRLIHTTEALDSIISMNVNLDRLVAGGSNSKICIWDIFTGECIYTLQTNSMMGNAMNVGVFGDNLVYGLPTSMYIIHSISKQRDIHELDLNGEETQVTTNHVLFPHHLTTPPAPLDPSIVYPEMTFGPFPSTILPGDPPPIHAEVEEIVPRTLALNCHILLTCASTFSGFLAWDLNTGTPIQTLSERAAMHRMESTQYPAMSLGEAAALGQEPNFLSLAELSRDGSLVFSVSDAVDHHHHHHHHHPEESQLLVWDFAPGRENDLTFGRWELEGGMGNAGIPVWIATERE